MADGNPDAHEDAPPAGLQVARLIGDKAEILIWLKPDGTIAAYNGRVDLGTGIATALAQIVAEELDVSVSDVTMALGDVRLGPDQGATVASTTLQVSAKPLRSAAAQARRWLLAEAKAVFQCDEEMLTTRDGAVHGPSGSNQFRFYAELVRDRSVRLILDPSVAVKPVAQYRLVGKSASRVDIPAKVTGEFVYVHDVRMPGMVHGRVVRPPYAGIDNGPFVGTSLLEVDESAARAVPGFLMTVTIGDFVGVVAEREEAAIKAAEALRVTWKTPPDLPDLGDIETTLRQGENRTRRLIDRGQFDLAFAEAKKRRSETYLWPYQMHGSIGPSCGVADVGPEKAVIWSGTQNPHWLQADIAALLDLPLAQVDVIRHEAAGCYGRNCADDVCADAALLSRAVGRPVRVQLSREQEHAWEPKGPGAAIKIAGGLDGKGDISAYSFENWWPSNHAPTLALILTGTLPPTFEFRESGDRTSVPPYAYENLRVTVNDARPIVRASWLRGVAALPNSFAHESFIDEMAFESGVDPVEYRLRHMKDERAAALIRAVAKRAGWKAHSAPTRDGDGEVMRGRGFAYAHYMHSKFPGFGAALSAWVADVEVTRSTGEVRVTKVIAGQDSGLMINPAGVRHQLHGNVIQATSRALKEEVRFDRKQVASREWGAYPIVTFVDVPKVDALLLPREDEPPLGGGESATVPSAAAIANAIYDATGVRFREVPFTPDRIKAGLHAAKPPRRRWLSTLVGSTMAAAAGFVAAIAWHAPLAPIAPLAPGSFPAEMIEKGRALALLGGCEACHTGPGRVAFAGGHRLQTPFGDIYSTNITPDSATGIGRWSFAAFDRAMRQGIHQDGRNLYPAFPYTSFAKVSEPDMQALYAFLMSLAPVSAKAPANELAFPFNQRWLLTGWNALFHRGSLPASDPARSAAWNRGAYLVNGLGHCTACHSPRNAFGAEKAGLHHLAGGMVEGWEAPPLNRLSKAPIRWTETAFYDYLKKGYSEEHGSASGPMTQVVRQLAQVPDSDIRAMATYLATLNEPTSDAATVNVSEPAGVENRMGRQLFEGACAVCHQPNPHLKTFGLRPPLAHNTNIHSDRPDNLVHVVLEGITEPAFADHGAMPSFAASLDDAQIAGLLRYMRQAFAPGKPPWDDLERTVQRIRAARAD
ncbi:MAG: molybdopterin cofactor-binding domain-containing protein [Parvibaculaceae bacterium]